MLSASRAICEQLGADLGDRLAARQVVGLELRVDQRVEPELVDERREAGDEAALLHQLGPEPEDEVADVADRDVEGVDRAIDAGRRLRRLRGHEVRHVLERQADRVEALDDPVVEVLADALALVDDREPLDLLVQPRVLDGDPRVEREHLDEALILLAELGGADLLGQVQVADRAVP